MYDDARAGPQARRIGAATPSSPQAKLRWLLDSNPDLAAGGVRLAHQPDLITRRLAGQNVATDSSHALKSGYDLVADRWPPGLTTTLPPGLLPDVVRPGTILGAVCPAAAHHTGLAPGTPIVAAMTDGCAAQVASGATRVGDWSSVLGTTLVLKGVCGAPIGEPDGVVYSHRAPDGEWLPGGASNCGAGALAAAFPGRDLDALTAAAMPHMTTNVLAYPLVGHGERFPFCAPAAQPFLVGRPTGEAELFAALLQGLAFVERLCFDVLHLHGAPIDGELTLSGAAAANSRLCQLRADVLGRPVRLVEHGESAFGAAILAASPGRRLADVSARMVRTGARSSPTGAVTARLAPRYEAFVKELSERGWLAPSAASHAVARCVTQLTNQAGRRS